MVVTQLRNYCIQSRLLGGEYNRELQTISKIKLEYISEELLAIAVLSPYLLCNNY